MSNESTTQQRQIWLIFFFLGVVMLNFPFLQIFNRVETFLGIPLLVIYLFFGWPISIAVIYIFTRTIEDDESDHSSEVD